MFAAIALVCGLEAGPYILDGCALVQAKHPIREEECFPILLEMQQFVEVALPKGAWIEEVKCVEFKHKGDKV